jgi:hypothetical protein
METMHAQAEEDRTEGPEGYFVQGSTSAHDLDDRRSRPGGRRATDMELSRAKRRLIWAYATASAMLAAGVLLTIAAWAD